jgi:hypothetical protein
MSIAPPIVNAAGGQSTDIAEGQSAFAPELEYYIFFNILNDSFGISRAFPA